MAHEHKQARPLFLELRALDPELHVAKDLADLTGNRVAITGLRSLSPAHADRIRRRVEAGKVAVEGAMGSMGRRPRGRAARGVWRRVPTKTWRKEVGATSGVKDPRQGATVIIRTSGSNVT